MAIIVGPQDQQLAGLTKGISVGLDALATGYQDKVNREREASKQLKQMGNLADYLGLEGEKRSQFLNLDPDQAKTILTEKSKATEKMQGQLDLLEQLGVISPQEATQGRSEIDVGKGQFELDDRLLQEGGLEDMLGMEPSSQQSIQPRGYTDEQIAGISVVNPPLAKIFQAQKDTADKNWMAERDFHTKQSDKTADRIDQQRNVVRRKDTAFRMAEDAVRSGEVGAFSLSNIGRHLGIRELETAKGAQLTTASKEHLIPNLQRLSARAQNQWLMKLFSSMFAEVGKSEAANMMAVAMLDEENKLDRREIDLFDEFAAQDEAETATADRSGYVKRDIEKRLDNAMQPEHEEMLKRLSYRTRRIWEDEQGLSNVAGKGVEKGTPLTLEMMTFLVDKHGKDKAMKVAETLGYTIPTIEEYRRYVQ